MSETSYIIIVPVLSAQECPSMHCVQHYQHRTYCIIVVLEQVKDMLIEFYLACRNVKLGIILYTVNLNAFIGSNCHKQVASTFPVVSDSWIFFLIFLYNFVQVAICRNDFPFGD